MSKRESHHGDLVLGPVMVHWLDAATACPGWENLTEAEPLEPLECYTLGMLFSEDDEAVVLLQTVTINDCVVQGRLVIPKGAILDIAGLTVKRKRHSKPKKRGKKAEEKDGDGLPDGDAV